jgi:hypothetical protein
MVTPLMTCELSRIQMRTSEIRASWSPGERRRRAEEGRRRMAQFLSLLGLREAEPAILAVGAPVYEDHRRIAG